MKKLLATIAAYMLAINFVYAQSLDGTNMDAVEKAVARLAKTFCGYVVAVGTTPGQTGAVPNERKNEIIRNSVPGLFWCYDDVPPNGPRYMITTNGPHGEIKKKKKMVDYFINLKAQSRSGFNSARKYELRYVGIIGNGNTKRFKFERVLSDGCELWSITIRIKQLYHKINFNSPTADGRAVESVETTVKDYTVYLVKKPNGKTGVYLGDVTQAYNE